MRRSSTAFRRGAGAACACCLLLFGACSNQPPEWSELVSSRIRNQYPGTQIQVLSRHTLKATLDARTITVDTDDIALQCNRGPGDCDRAIDQVLLDLRGGNPGVDGK